MKELLSNERACQIAKLVLESLKNYQKVSKKVSICHILMKKYSTGLINLSEHGMFTVQLYFYGVSKKLLEIENKKGYWFTASNAYLFSQKRIDFLESFIEHLNNSGNENK